MSSRRPIGAASAAGARGRAHHSLAPPHLGEATAAATVAVAVAGIAGVVTGIGIVAMAVTLPARYGANPPPNLGALTLPPLLGGIGLTLLGVLLAAGAIAVLVGARRARTATGVLAAASALLAALGVVLAMAVPPADAVLAIALTVSALILGAASILLLRPRR